MDIQECPKADIAICSLVIEVLKALVHNDFCSLQAQKRWTKEALFPIFNDAIKHAENSKIKNIEYLKLFRIKKVSTVNDVWRQLYLAVKPKLHNSHYEAIEFILEEGTLATRLLKSIGNNTSKEHIISVYRTMQNCLKTNTLFQP